MNEHVLERELQEWLTDDVVTTSPWVLPSVMEHAQQHSNQAWWHRLADLLLPTRGVTGASPSPLLRPAAAVLVLVAVSLLVTAPAALWLSSPTPETDPAFVPVSTEPATTAPPSDESGFPSTGGLVGSLWLEQTPGGRDSYVTLHPDGTIVRVSEGLGRPVGIGAWQPTGDRSLTSLVAYPDADPLNHIQPGFSTHRADWVLDEDGSTATLTWTASVEPDDGSAAPDVTGTSSLVRLQREPLPPQAKFPSPDEPAWELALGTMAQGPGSGSVAAIGNQAALASDCTDPLVPPEYLVTHGDGTTFLASRSRGSGTGLWVPTGPNVEALTAWFGLSGSGRLTNDVAQLIHTGGPSGQVAVTVGSSEGFRENYGAKTRSIQPMEEPLPAVDATLWPERGSVWLQPTDSGTAITAYLADGTVVARDPRYGVGAGYWQPLDADTIAAWVAFSTIPGQDHNIWSEATTSPDGQTLSIDYKYQDKSSGPVETGSASAARLRIEQ